MMTKYLLCFQVARFARIKTAQKANLPDIEIKTMLYTLMDDLATALQ